MMRIPVRSVWSSVVDYYYITIQPYEPKYTIWRWIETEYRGKKQWGRRGGHHEDFFNYDFVFEDDTDATAFKLKFMQHATA